MHRDIDDLEAHACKLWPATLAERERKTSILPRLLESQEKFIGLLHVADASPVAWKKVLRQTKDLPANLFLKHLIVLCDLGGEKLQRYRKDIRKYFPKGEMRFRWKDTEDVYIFQSMTSTKAWTNAVLRVGGFGLAVASNLSAAMEDVAMLLIHGGSSPDSNVPDEILAKCVIGSLIGQKRELDSFVRQRYIHVSRITGGATANRMGHLCQAYVRERLQSALPTWNFTRSTIPGISHNAGHTDMSFDVVARSPSGKCCAIEISFQVTTNSTIERKAGQAKARQELLHRKGHRIAYVIDGAGNFVRRSALSTILRCSDRTVAFTDEELDDLAKFLRTVG
jgi:hypothetical protein